MKKILLVITTLFILPIFAFAASVKTSYDTEKCILTVSGNQSGNEAVVSLFNKNSDLIGLKTDGIEGEKYNTEFVLTYNTDTKIDITVANEDGNNEVSKKDVNIPACQLSRRTIYSDNGDYLSFIEANREFDPKDVLYVEYIFDFSSLDEDEQALLNSIKELLDSEKKFAGIIVIGIADDHGDKELPDTNKGLELFLKVDKDTLSKYTNPHMARVLLDGEKIELEDGLKMTIDDSIGGVLNKVNNVGIYVLYEDLSKPKEEVVSENNQKEVSNNKSNPKTGDLILKYVSMAIVSGLGLVALNRKFKKTR